MVVATSGDTGSAALAGFKDIPGEHYELYRIQSNMRFSLELW